MRVFLDTNVLVSAFASRGLCADLFELVLLEHDLVIGNNVLRELDKALRTKIKLSEVRSAEIADFIAGEAVSIVKKSGPVEGEISAGDAIVLGEALAGEAEIFVTGGAALLALGRTEGLRVVSPRGFWEMLRSM